MAPACDRNAPFITSIMPIHSRHDGIVSLQPMNFDVSWNRLDSGTELCFECVCVFGGAVPKGVREGGSKTAPFWQKRITHRNQEHMLRVSGDRGWLTESCSAKAQILCETQLRCYVGPINIINSQLHTEADYDDLSKSATSRTLSLYWFSVGFREPPHIRLTLQQNVGTCETLVEPSVTLQMALLVKVGHGRTLSSTEGRTMEITGVWSLGLNTVWGLQDMGRGTLPWSLNHTSCFSHNKEL